jgi:hypothetical protein
VPFNVFKDPYLLDMLRLRDNYLEADLEKAILSELEAFILEFGNGLAFVERQKRMSIDEDDIVLDLLFYNRVLERLVAVELKIGCFKAAYKGQMELYLKWLDAYERKPNENSPIDLILCATANRRTVELLEMDKAGIVVAEYWATLPPKAALEEKSAQFSRKLKNASNAKNNCRRRMRSSNSPIFTNPKTTWMIEFGASIVIEADKGHRRRTNRLDATDLEGTGRKRRQALLPPLLLSFRCYPV